MRKGAIVALTGVACAVILAVSSFVYQTRIEEAGNSPATRPIKNEQSAVAVESQESENTEVPQTALTGEALSALSANLPDQAKTMLKARLEEGSSVQILLIGSESFEAPAGQLADSMSESYEGWVETDVFINDGTSEQLINDRVGEIDWSKGYDLVVYEPFTLNNNGVVVIEDEWEHTLSVQSLAKEAVEDVAFFVTPPQPIHNPNYYRTQIQALHQFVGEQDIPFIDHWGHWPDVDDEGILEYVDQDYQPTDQGVEAWSTALREYFIAS